MKHYEIINTESYESIKLGIDAHVKWYYVARQLDGATRNRCRRWTLRAESAKLTSQIEATAASWRTTLEPMKPDDPVTRAQSGLKSMLLAGSQLRQFLL